MVVYGVCVFVGVLLLLVCECLWVVGSICLFVLFVIVWCCMCYVCYFVCGCVLSLYTYVKSCLCACVICCVMLYGVCVFCVLVMCVPVQCLMRLCGMFVIYCVRLHRVLFVFCLCGCVCCYVCLWY